MGRDLFLNVFDSISILYINYFHKIMDLVASLPPVPPPAQPWKVIELFIVFILFQTVRQQTKALTELAQMSNNSVHGRTNK